MLFSIKQRQMVEKFYPNYQEYLFSNLLDDAIRSSNIVLDAGCGDGRLFHYEYKNRVKMLIGVDIDDNLSRNKQIHYAITSSIEKLPFASNSFDVVFSRFVIEHLENPEASFYEFWRVLQPGGKLIIITPNKYHYFAISNRLIPHSLQQVIVQKYLKHINFDEGDVYRTYYRCNSIREMTAIAQRSSLKVVNVMAQECWPIYMAFSPITFYLAVVYERLVNRFSFLSSFRSQLVGVFQK